MTKIKNKTTGDWEDVANLAQSDSVRNPDWSRAIALTSAQLLAGWTAPEDGVIVGDFLPSQTVTGAVRLTINNVLVAFAFNNSQGGGQDIRNGLAGTQVAAGDILKISQAIIVDGNYTVRFVPYRVQKSVEESHAVIQITNEVVNNSTVLPSGDTTTPVEIAKFVFPKKGVYFISANFTIPNTAILGICITEPAWIVAPPSGATAGFTKTLNVPSDNYTLPIKAKLSSTYAGGGTVTSNAVQGQAIKLY